MTANHQPLIWALDLATVTGFAVGRVDDKPEAWTIRLAPTGSVPDDLFAGAYAWWRDTLERRPKPDILAIEELLPPIARRGSTSTGAQHRLAGLHGIIRGLARAAGIPEIMGVNVNAVRSHFIQARYLRRDEAKRAVMVRCKMLGWTATDNNMGDALALWSYAQSLINPATALAVTPLFATWSEVAEARQAE